jgi:uncharacterized protein YndB with AHSA1/START domain
MLEPLVSRIEVACDQKTAFTIFVEQMGAWWPLTKRSMSMKSGQPPKMLRTDPRPGGTIVEIAQNGAEHHWGTYKRIVPHEFVSMDFHMGMPPTKASLVEVRFAPASAKRTQVELTQSNWEAFGDMAEMLRGHYGSGWVVIFETAFRNACGAAAAVDGNAVRSGK